MNGKPSAIMCEYGTLGDNIQVNKVTLKNSHGIEVDVISYGGIITRLITPDNQGIMGNIVLGMDALSDYVNKNPYYLGAIIGRYGNRIAKGRFTVNATQYQLATNNGDDHLHGGVQGFDKKVWQMEPFENATSAAVRLTLVSPDGDQGYPGTLTTEVTYMLTDENTLDMRFVATTDKPTIVNLTQHSYFNLLGQGDILGHKLRIPAASITAVDSGLIPTGELMAVTGTPFDFCQLKTIGDDINAPNEQLAKGNGYDHNFVLKTDPDEQLVEAAYVEEPVSGRTLTVLTEAPAMQFYSGNFLTGDTQGNGMTHHYRSGLCLEPQHNPDSPNQSGFASTTLLPGEVYSTRIMYEFGTA